MYGTPHGILIERNADLAIKNMTAKEAAAHYGVSVSTIYRRAKAGKLIASKINGRWVITNAGTTVEVAEKAADFLNSTKARNILQLSLFHTVPQYDSNEYADDMFARRRAALALAN